MVLERVKKVLKRKKKGERKIALFVDGPNMLRKDVAVDLKKVRNVLDDFGSIKIAKVFLNQYAPEKLIEAIINQGFEPMILSTDDIDAPMAGEVVETLYNPHIDTVALVTRDSDFQPIILKAKKHGKETIVITAEPCGAALKNAADYVVVLE